MLRLQLHPHSNLHACTHIPTIPPMYHASRYAMFTLGAYELLQSSLRKHRASDAGKGAYCTVLYCSALFCTRLYCFVLFYTTMTQIYDLPPVSIAPNPLLSSLPHVPPGNLILAHTKMHTFTCVFLSSRTKPSTSDICTHLILHALTPIHAQNFRMTMECL